jgi:hypothetical protein
MNTKRYVGCCGAYCKTCNSFLEGFCISCKDDVDTDERDINKTKCKIILCCYRDKNFDSCADCSELESCNIIGNFYSKSGYKNSKYKQVVEFIKLNDYSKFIKIADRWKCAYGKLE